MIWLEYSGSTPNILWVSRYTRWFIRSQWWLNSLLNKNNLKSKKIKKITYILRRFVSCLAIFRELCLSRKSKMAYIGAGLSRSRWWYWLKLYRGVERAMQKKYMNKIWITIKYLIFNPDGAARLCILFLLHNCINC